MIAPRVVVLNGTSSSGKTSIARAIQRLAAPDAPWLHASLDTFTDMFAWEAIHDDALRRECHRVGVDNFHAALRLLVTSRFPVVVDHVFEQQAWHEACRAALKSVAVLFVAVHCPLDVLEIREAARPDRRRGLARWQFDRVHAGRSYDLDVDTSRATPGECATRILTAAHYGTT